MTQPAIPASYGARQAQPLDDILDQVGAVSLDAMLEQLRGGVDRRGSWGEEFTERAEGAAKAAAAVAKSRAGRELLEYLADVSVRRPMFVLDRPNGLEFAAFREGQNALFYTLLALVAAGRQETPPVREAP
jgi:hypothetical protein